ncbi:hypothetical protein HAX54_027909 [Datura stramonium]|uniref:Uncharacterized protein n=1 Tax=Datura stramonium TaxID=4076 RepID=A0ABS8V5H4_DATST|nr:hypothetical protein [Datura stramonium]
MHLHLSVLPHVCLKYGNSEVQTTSRENLSELPAEAEEVRRWAEGDDNLKDANFKEQQSGPRSHQGKATGVIAMGVEGSPLRKYSDGRGGVVGSFLPEWTQPIL